MGHTNRRRICAASATSGPAAARPRDGGRMHHYRVMLHGPDPALRRIESDLRACGATPVPGARSVLTLRSEQGPIAWMDVSRRHPAVTLTVEGFEAFVDDHVRLHAVGGAVTVMDRRAVLAEDAAWRLDDDVPACGPELLHAAAAAISARRSTCRVGTLSCGLDVALTVG